jgi:hypothetical protein
MAQTDEPSLYAVVYCTATISGNEVEHIVSVTLVKKGGCGYESHL